MNNITHCIYRFPINPDYHDFKVTNYSEFKAIMTRRASFYLILNRNHPYTSYLTRYISTETDTLYLDFFNASSDSGTLILSPSNDIFKFLNQSSSYVAPDILAANNIDPKTAADNCVFSTYLTEDNVTLEFNAETSTVAITVNSLQAFYIDKNSTQTYIDLGNVPITQIFHRDEEYKTALEIYLDPQTWSDPIAVNVHILDDIIEGLRGRYLFTERPRNGLSNVVVDSFFPRLLYKHKLNITNVLLDEKPLLPKTACAISPFIASVLGVKQIPINQLIRILGYTEKDIKQLFDAVKAKELTFVFVGAGGTGLNTAVWLNNLAEASNSINLFKKVYVYEEDDIEFSNLLRFPINPSMIAPILCLNSSKLDLISNYISRLSRNKPIFSATFIGNNYHSYNYELFRNEWNSDKSNYNYYTREKVVLYGAPDIRTRVNLSNAGRFIAATHADNGCSIYLNPEQDTTIQVESYGMIQLNTFFMNQLHMAIKLLEILASDQDLEAKDVLLDEFSFDGTLIKQTDREYNFHIETTTAVLTEEDAVAF